MPQSPIPVFFLAFANAPEQSYLQQLKQESKRLRNLLLPLDKAGQIALLREERTDNEDIPQLLTDYHDQVAVFHYGGHADGKQLLFENLPGQVAGLAGLLALQQNLKLAFLNGCSTLGQAEPYLDAGVPAVIATTRSVSDADAVFFAESFYRALVNRSSLRESFQTAVAALRNRTDKYGVGEEVVVFRGIVTPGQAAAEAVPWRLCVREDRQGVLDWTLPETVPGEQEVVVVLGNSKEYKRIRQELEKLRTKLREKSAQLEALPDPLPEVLAPVKEGLEKDRLELGMALEKQQKIEQHFKEEVLRLEEAFRQIDPNATGHLQQARALFEAGKLSEADRVLKGEELSEAQYDLLQERDRLEHELAEVQRRLRDNAAEFLIKAQLTVSLQGGKKAGWTEEAAGYFRQSFRSYAYYENLLAAADFLQRQKKYEEAEAIYGEAMKPGLPPAQEATVLNNLGNLYRGRNDFKNARRCYRKALGIRRRLAKTDEQAFLPKVAVTLNNLANLHVRENQFEEARACYDESLAIRRKLAEKDARQYLPDVASTLNNLGNLHRTLTQFDEAGNCLEEALKIRRDLAATDPQVFLPDVAATLNNSGLLHAELDDFEQALSCYQEALAIRRQLAKDNEQAFLPEVAATLNNLGNLHKSTLDYQAARDCFDEALAIRRRLAAADERAYLPEVASTLNNLGILYQAREAYGEARGAFDEALAIRRKLARDIGPAFLQEVGKSLNNLGLLCAAQKDYATARQFYEEALDIRRQLKQRNAAAFRPELAATLNNLGNACQSLGLLEEARGYFGEALDIRRQLAQHKSNGRAFLPVVAATLSNLGSLHLAAARYEEARACLDEALQINRSLTAVNPRAFNTALAVTLVYLGACLIREDATRGQGKACLEEAIAITEPLFERAPFVKTYYDMARRLKEELGR